MMTITDPRMSPRWLAFKTELAAVTDGLGMPIDAGILDTCIALNVLGFHTMMSCEGHIGKTIQAPWVSIRNERACELDHQVANILEQEHVFDEAVMADIRMSGDMPAWRQAVFERTSGMRHESWQIMAEMQYRMLGLIQAFYSGHEAATDQRLIVYPDVSGTIRLLSQGAWAAIAFNPAEQQQKLAEYQAEMHAFTEYLITLC